MNLDNFKKGMKVIYVPNHALGDINHVDNQFGVVSSINNKFIFVKYDCLACTMITGDEPYTAQATCVENLIMR